MHILIKSVSDHVDTVKISEILLEDRVPLEENDKRGISPPPPTKESGITLASFLIQKRSSVNRKSEKNAISQLYSATISSLVDLLLSYGADVKACSNLHRSTVSLLLQKTADVSAQTKDRKTLLSILIEYFDLNEYYQTNLKLGANALIRKFSVLRIKNYLVFQSYLNLIKNTPELQRYLDNITKEMYEMVLHYSVLELSKNIEKLTKQKFLDKPLK